jgi:hypothetical protein
MKRRVILPSLAARLAIFATAVAAVLAWSCGDPVHDARVDALGPETNGGPGPTHRPGQPCLACHDDQGPGKPELSVAGTIYQSAAAGSPPLAGAIVTVYDATQDADGGAPHTFGTNSAGNFYVPASEWTPVFPLHDISITLPNGTAPTTMHTVVGRDGSCATCHFDPKGTNSHGHIYLVVDPADLTGAMP